LTERSPAAPVVTRRPTPATPAVPSRQQRWTSERPPRAGLPSQEDAATPLEQPSDPTTPVDAPVAPTSPSGLGAGVAGGVLIALTIVSTRYGGPGLGTVFVPAGGVCLAVAAARRIRRTRPAEAWVGRWLILGVLLKLAAAYFRHFNLVKGYEGVGDATGYDNFGRQFARAWSNGSSAPKLEDLRETNFIRWFTGVVYYLFGSNLLLGYFVFGLLAFVGAYLWYRATVDAVPIVDKRWYLGLMLFAPSIVFWPSSVGKESLMQLGIGVMAVGASLVLRQRLSAGLGWILAGGWLVWVIRPHLLAGIAVATGFAYFVGRVRSPEHGRARAFLTRPVGIVILGLLLVVAVTQGAQFLGIEDLSVQSIEAELDEQTERSSIGGSSFETSGNSLSPLNLPIATVTVLFRPFAWETDSGLQLVASLESALLLVFIVVRLASLRLSLVRARALPYLIYCWSLAVLYIIAFSSFANFGLLVRQRSLLLPALFAVLCVSPALDRAERARRSASAPDLVRD
jgi:hypothetical protein